MVANSGAHPFSNIPFSCIPFPSLWICIFRYLFRIVFLSYKALFLRQRLSLNLDLVVLARLPVQGHPSICWSLLLSP